MSKYAARSFGRDRVEEHGNSLTIITPLPHIAGWEVRKYRAPVIRYDGRTWRIAKKITGPDKLTRYELVAWEPLEGEVTGPEIDYSEEYAVLRDHALEMGRRRSRGTMWLNYVGPLTGFLPARMKQRLEAQYGIDPVTATKWSVFIEFLVTLAAFVLSSIGTMVIALGYPSPILPLVTISIGVICGVDAGVRYGRVLAEERLPPGFYEWLLKRRK